MILKVNYEEMLALRAGVRAVLGTGPTGPVAVASRPGDRAAVEKLPVLDGDLSVETLAELGDIDAAVEAIIHTLRDTMDEAILATHPASEDAVVVLTQAPLDPEMLLRVMGGQVVCSTCHNQHKGEAPFGGDSRVSPAEQVTALGSTGVVIAVSQRRMYFPVFDLIKK